MTPNEQPVGHPVRRCASCRARHEASRLVRLVASEDGGVRVDIERRIPGRGLNLCPNPDCFHDALRKNLFRRSLGVTQRCDLDAIMASFVDEAHGALSRLLHDARRADGVGGVNRDDVTPGAYRTLLLSEEADPRVRALPSLSIRNRRIAARVDGLSDLLNRFTFTPPGAKTRRPGSAQRAGSRTAEESRASGEL